VLVFAGPSGHGKTELAKRLGQLLTLELECVDSTEIRRESDLFGPKQPYMGYEKGSPLNNFLTRMSGNRAIVFLDEFEKTTREVQNACLIPFDEGKYVDRRNREAVDCSKTIWIIATNALDRKIVDFCEKNPGVLTNDDQDKHARLMTDLEKTLKKQLKHTFGNPLSGRISAVLPFLPFSLGEQAVVAHKYILELKHKVLTPVNLSSGKLVGRVLLHIKSDGAVCKAVSTEGYDPDQGARSLQTAVKTRIEEELVHTYLEEDEVISETQPLADYTVDIQQDGTLLIFKSTGAEKSFAD
jgi:ATP-dependent Clp protease ATP-binding subunit ClpA